MSEIKWIKITTNMFEDEKIDFISGLPEGDSLLVIWVRLLTMAGKCNSNGFIMLSESIPYDEDMLAHKFKKPSTIIKLALETFQRLDMLTKNNDGCFIITNWDKHQNVLSLEKIRNQTRKRVAKHREILKKISSNSSLDLKDKELKDLKDKEIKDNKKDIDIRAKNVTCNVTNCVTSIYKEIIDYLNDVCGTRYRLVDSNKKHINARLEDGYALDDFKIVIDKKYAEWNGTEQSKYLRPETLFGTKFDSYLNQLETKNKKSRQSSVTLDAIKDFYGDDIFGIASGSDNQETATKSTEGVENTITIDVSVSKCEDRD
jgi:predicted phage replisome organizer/uncharacterized phage protein (TIGR02220 family)